MRGIVLAGGTGSRLWPITKVTSKQLLPVYDKPMIYYPISTLMLAGVNEILIISTPHDTPEFERLLGDGSKFGIVIKYAVQPNPDGIAQAFIIGQEFLDGDSCLMILGDNIFYGAGLGEQLQKTIPKTGAHIFTYRVSDPTRYGVLVTDDKGEPIAVEEKPTNPTSDLAVTGLYFFDNRVVEEAKLVQPSNRGELEITSLIGSYLAKKELGVTHLTRGTAWLDTGTPESMHDASTFVRVIEERTGLKIACLEEVALRMGWLEPNMIKLSLTSGNAYSDYLLKVIDALA